eukprot:266138-Chlamydomonas_euryale.AAC.2
MPAPAQTPAQMPVQVPAQMPTHMPAQMPAQMPTQMPAPAPLHVRLHLSLCLGPKLGSGGRPATLIAACSRCRWDTSEMTPSDPLGWLRLRCNTHTHFHGCRLLSTWLCLRELN